MSHPVPPGQDEAVAEIARATTVSFGPSGVAAALQPALLAMHALHEAGDDARDSAGWLLDNAGPEGRVYAATLLGMFDEAAGRAAWERLSADRDEFTHLFGCIGIRRTVGEYAREQLEPPVPPPSPRARGWWARHR